MPKNVHSDPFGALLARAAHDPELSARLQAVQREEPAPEPSPPRPPRQFPTPIYPARIEPPIEPSEPAASEPAASEPAASELADASDCPASDPAWTKAPPANRPQSGGRARKVAPWFGDVARAMADGTSLRVALARCTVQLTERALHS